MLQPRGPVAGFTCFREEGFFVSRVCAYREIEGMLCSGLKEEVLCYGIRVLLCSSLVSLSLSEKKNASKIVSWSNDKFSRFGIGLGERLLGEIDDLNQYENTSVINDSSRDLGLINLEEW